MKNLLFYNLKLEQAMRNLASQFVMISTVKCLVGQIDLENLNKRTPLNGASLFGKKKQTAWSTFVSSYLVLFIFVFVYVLREMEVTGKWNRTGSSEDYESHFALYCSVHLQAVIEHCTSSW